MMPYQFDSPNDERTNLAVQLGHIFDALEGISRRLDIANGRADKGEDNLAKQSHRIRDIEINLGPAGTVRAKSGGANTSLISSVAATGVALGAAVAALILKLIE